MRRIEFWRWMPWRYRWIGEPWLHSRDGSYIGTVWLKVKR